MKAQESNSAVCRHTLNKLCGHIIGIGPLWLVPLGVTLYKVDNTPLFPLLSLIVSCPTLQSHLVQLLAQFHLSSFLNFPCGLFTTPDNNFFLSFFKIIFFTVYTELEHVPLSLNVLHNNYFPRPLFLLGRWVGYRVDGAV